MKKIYILTSMAVLAILLQSGIKFHTVPPAGRTGATGAYCNACHGSAATNPINTGGGNIVATGLPAGGIYTPGQAYPFSIQITHGTADRLRWGFSIAARRTDGTAVGTFSTTNPVAAINSNTTPATQELSHFNTVIGAASNTFTFDNLTWTAPATLPADANVTFFYVGNATNGNGANSGDFIYAGSTTVTLPIDLKGFTATVINNKAAGLQWETLSESNSDYFDVQKSDDNQLFYSIGRVAAAGNSTALKQYGFTDATISFYDKPVFYRLNLVDKDGKSKISKTVSVQLKGGAVFVQNLFPSLVKPNAYVTANIRSDKAQPLRIDLLDLSGRLVKTYQENLVKGGNLIDFKLPGTLPATWIFARFSAGSIHQTMPLVVNP